MAPDDRRIVDPPPIVTIISLRTVLLIDGVTIMGKLRLYISLLGLITVWFAIGVAYVFTPRVCVYPEDSTAGAA